MVLPAAIPLPSSARKYAPDSAGLFVGVREFEDPGLPKVAFAADDAVDLAHLFVIELGLLDPAKTILMIAGSPQKKESKQRLDQLESANVARVPARSREVYSQVHRLGQRTGPNGLFVVSFATHGVTDQGQAVLVMTETLKRRAVHTGLILDLVLDDLAGARAARRLVLVDACRERYDRSTRNVGNAIEPMGEAFVKAMVASRGCAVLAGASRGGFAYDDLHLKNGVFTAALLDGLRGGAEGDSQGIITLEKLEKFAHRRVVNWIAENRPEHKEISLGITPNYDPRSIRSLPLAIHGRTQQMRFEDRRKESLAVLVKSVDPRDKLFQDIEGALRCSQPLQEHLDLLDELAAFDGSRRGRHALRGFLIENASRLGLARDDSGAGPHETKELRPMSEVSPKATGTAARRRSPGKNTRSAAKPAWAVIDGEDQLGRWATLRVGHFDQRMRWIEPGEFRMGSPENEKGRYGNEVLPRRVKIEKGFWLADTPCVQGIWQLLMGSNPSRFKSPLRPVEQIKAMDSQFFLDRLADLLSGAKPRLPTEEEWEYACRAGTEASTYAGELDILGENNAPLLDPIAWYGGNSGVELSIGNGYDSRDWEDKQYPHLKAGSRQVAKKLPNKWGLYDMLGNVWERCRVSAEADTASESGRRNFEDEDLHRFRGGSWFSGARWVRAAARIENASSLLESTLGFRFMILQDP